MLNINVNVKCLSTHLAAYAHTFGKIHFGEIRKVSSDQINMVGMAPALRVMQRNGNESISLIQRCMTMA